MKCNGGSERMDSLESEAGNTSTRPLWRTASPAEAGEGNDEIRQAPRQADTVVIGAGIAGLSVAYSLLEAGHAVVVLDMSGIGAGETGNSTAHLCDALDDRYFLLERMHGRKGAQHAAASHRAAIESIDRIVHAEQIACGFEYLDGLLIDADPKGSPRFLERECEAALRAGVKVELDMTGMADRFGSPAVLRFTRQAQVDPLAYVRGLARAVEQKGGVICTGRRVRSIERAHAEWTVHLEDGAHMVCRHVVVATNSPFNDVFAMHTKQAAYRSYVLGVRASASVLPKALLWDTGDPYHYLRWADEETLLIGGADHRVGQSAHPERSWGELERWTRERFRVGEVVARWSGQILEPADGLGYIGRNPGFEHDCFIVTGDSGNGMTHGALAGLLIRDLVSGKKNDWQRLYDPSRKPNDLHSLKEYLIENAKVAVSYGDWLRPSLSEETDVTRGHGEIVQHGLRKLAIYVDEHGERHECSAVCPHLGGIVHWNGAEQSWDCPCHGSRFDAYGRLLTGPATRDLAPEIKDERERPQVESPVS